MIRLSRTASSRTSLCQVRTARSRTSVRQVRRGALAVVACLLLGGCRDRPAPAEPPGLASTVTGAWTGVLSDLQSLDLRLLQDSTGTVTGSGVLWLGDISILLSISGIVNGNAMSLVLADSLGPSIGGPDTFAGRVSATAMFGTFTSGPFRVPVTFRRTSSGILSFAAAASLHRQTPAHIVSGRSLFTIPHVMTRECGKSIRPRA